MRIFRQCYQARDGRSRQSRKWYVEVTDHEGRPRRVPGFVSKSATKELGSNLEELISLRFVQQPPTPQLSAWLESMPATLSRRLADWGIIDSRHVPHGKTLLEHLDDYHAAMLDSGATASHAETVRSRVRNLLVGCRFAYFVDIEPSRVVKFLADCRRHGLPKSVAVAIHGEKKASRIARGPMSHQTSNFYLQSLKQFCLWLEHEKRSSASPVAHLSGLNVKLDRRHDRRNLSADELSRLLRAAVAGPTHHRLDGTARAILYRVAMETGFRRNELWSLTVDCLDLDSDSPTITLSPNATKNRKGVTQAIRRELADELKHWLGPRLLEATTKL